MLNNMEIVGYIKDAKVIENWERLGIRGLASCGVATRVVLGL
jgi:hypothetical protein